jgi:hypothetical protein
MFISLLPFGILHGNPFQNLFFVDSYSYFCEIWRRAGTLDSTQKYWLDNVSTIYSNTNYECRTLLGSYYPGAPIFSRLSFFLPFQVSALVHPFIGPMTIHFLAQIVLLLVILKIFIRLKVSRRVKLSSILFFSNPSLVYPIFAFGTEKYQLIILSILFMLIDSVNRDLKTKKIIIFALLIAYLMLLRENLPWSLFFCLQYLGNYRKTSDKIMVFLFLGFSSILYYLQDKFAAWNTPNFVVDLGGSRISDEEGALARLFSKEFFTLVDRSVGADLRAMFGNFTIFDVVTILFILVLLNGFWLKINSISDSILIVICLLIGVINSAVSAAFFLDLEIVTFFRLFIPSVWIVILVTSKIDTHSLKK